MYYVYFILSVYCFYVEMSLVDVVWNFPFEWNINSILVLNLILLLYIIGSRATNFKRPLLSVSRRVCVCVCVPVCPNCNSNDYSQCSLGGMVTPNASSPRVLSRMSWYFNKTFYDSMCLKGSHGWLICFLVSKCVDWLWHLEYNIIVTWRHRWRHKSTRHRHFTIGPY